MSDRSDLAAPFASALKAAFRSHFPKLWVAWRAANLNNSMAAELKLMALLADARRCSVDAGANIGVYTRKLAKLSRKVHAFEPSHEMAELLRRTVAGNVVVHEIGLSDRVREATLHIPLAHGRAEHALASVERNSAGIEGATSEKVGLLPLDDVVQEDVGFIKIDVEGHELQVLRGGIALISRCRPAFLIECEERHNPGGVAKLFEYFDSLKYWGFFLKAGLPLPLEKFNLNRDQNGALLAPDVGASPSDEYVNGFIFVPDSLKRDELHRASGA